MAAPKIAAHSTQELRSLRRLTEAQARELAQAREELNAFQLLHDDEAEAQLLDVEAVKRELLELRDLVWPELLALRVHAAHLEAESETLREELEGARSSVRAVTELRAQLADATSDSSELKSRCNALVHELQLAVETAERAEARVRAVEEDERHGGARTQLRATQTAEMRQRARADALAAELRQHQREPPERIASRGRARKAAPVVARRASRSADDRHRLDQSIHGVRGYSDPTSADDDQDGPGCWASAAGTGARARGAGSRADSRNTDDDASTDGGADDGRRPARRRAAGDSPSERAHKLEVRAKLQELHAAFRKGVSRRASGEV
jgi:hypothetical protein